MSFTWIPTWSIMRTSVPIVSRASRRREGTTYNMIEGVHAIFWPDARRAPGLPGGQLRLHVHDIGDGWLHLRSAEGDIGVHPGESRAPTTSPSTATTSTARSPRSRAAACPSRRDVEDHGYGLVTYFTAPGGITVQLYEPRYEKRKR